MHLRTHLIASALAGLALYPRSPRRAALVILGGVGIDLDHLVLYGARSGDWSPAGAMRYNRYRHGTPRRGDTRPRYGSLRSVAHQPQLTLGLLWLLSRAWPGLRPLLAGAALHLALDVYFPMLDPRAWRRAGGRCERCGTYGVSRQVYVRRLPSGTSRSVLCGMCIREHAAGLPAPQLRPAGVGECAPAGE